MAHTLKTAPIVAIHGPLNAGKDTIATIIDDLQLRFGGAPFAHYKFARPLKDAARVMFGFTHTQLEDRVLKEAVDPFWGFSPRKAIQLLGTEYGRNMLREDIWIKRAEQEIIKNTEVGFRTIISDLRFQNEADWCDKMNALTIVITTPAEADNNIARVHSSEAGIEPRPHHVYIQNDKTKGIGYLTSILEDLYEA